MYSITTLKLGIALCGNFTIYICNEASSDMIVTEHIERSRVGSIRIILLLLLVGILRHTFILSRHDCSMHNNSCQQEASRIVL